MAAAASRTNLLGLDRGQLAAWLGERGEQPYKARQLLRWIHRKHERDFERMHDLSAKLRATLAAEATLETPPLTETSVAADATRKHLYDVGGGSVEAVWIPEAKRATLCVSSQAGCALACTFCLTGKQGFAKNLSSAQIMGQYHHALQDAGTVSNVVFMGMGEPLLNLEQVVPALRLLTDDLACGLSRRRVTVSTAGVVPGIERLAAEAPVALAVSLHAPVDELRSELVPLNRRYPLRDLLRACRGYLKAAPRDFITFEYVLLDRVNDDLALARDTARLLAKTPGKVNLIPFNPFPGAPYQAPSRNRVMAFRDELNARGVVATVRRQRGDDILAACGQLAGKVAGRVPAAGRIATPIIPAP
ncbi:MAG: 23S rRNA (adenine(2503)-C(2))-methyltransferase RlmN [Betaproteobacteria bacterium AqS2]|uniref:Dual-specificity RNA methyltransferase RlmN n=1 Tax=Candidatus Amphirhobacter heronislandensis TaxID=1732024 RepID=A0A930XX48_9GAMM|nr:23S rRNA (adenine(2503)-C(2))-methyltransferase RlmN [Betaproteobacteria bacterium AqS2]